MSSQTDQTSPRRRGLRDERGLTLIEMLVVMLIVAALAAIGLPSFLGQRARAQDLDAKLVIATTAVTLRSHQVEADTFNLTVPEIKAKEPSLVNANDLVVATTDDTYTISERSVSGTTFTVSRDAAGVSKRTCSHPGRGGCSRTPDAEGNRW